MLEAVHVTMITQVALNTPEGVGKLLDAFESVQRLTPTNWGPDERARNPYEREEVVSTVSAMQGRFSMPGLARRKPPRYAAYFLATSIGLKELRVEFGSGLSKKDVKQVFDLAAAFADALEPEYGFVHLINRAKDKKGVYSISGNMTSEKLQECGPKPPPARTWYGVHMAGLIGRERLESAGLVVRETGWGGIEVDLAEDPWDAEIDALIAKQAAVMQHLEASGVFGDYKSWHNCKPGPNWTPIIVKGSD